MHSRDNRNPGGRPVGTTNEARKCYEDRVKAAKYKITCQYAYESKSTHVPKELLYNLITVDEKENFGLGNDFCFPYRTCLSRIYRKRLEGIRNPSPMLDIENKVVNLILCMSKMKQSLTSSEGLVLINELICDTETQQLLREWKLNCNIFFTSDDDLGKVGIKYWRNFLKRNRHLLRSKSGRKYAVDRCNWTTYLNFADMYEHIEDILVCDSKSARKLDQPQWMDIEGNVVDSEDQAYGCKVEIVLE